MPRTKKSDGFHCPLCGYEIEVHVIAYRSEPFIDGRYYEDLCWVCNNVPQTYHFDAKKNELVIYPWRPDKLHTFEGMVDTFGCDKDKETKKRVNKSIRSVKTATNSMNEDKRIALIEVSKKGEMRCFIDPDDSSKDAPQEPDPPKKPPAKHSRKKT